MKAYSLHRARRAAWVLFLGLGVAATAVASRPGGGSVPAASAVQGAPQQAAEAQADESASLRQGLVTALDSSGARLQVQGIWLDVVAGKTQVLRGGKVVAFATLKVGETIRFTVTPASGPTLSLGVVYAP